LTFSITKSFLYLRLGLSTIPFGLACHIVFAKFRLYLNYVYSHVLDMLRL
jgi:hypothetical protein